ncbi:N-acetylglucosamine-6-phosphate deacetylase [Nocardioides deserti]|uniref:Amidohydrolase family protein n=1 Tax=Nocardioides deserti TaxID=1588644 RepID=A0ABR6U4I6_9ACTN|nr:amidohydrolase family protein [Nocardioides deserti]MBC2959300.1 amidohydrolase family protein [Nocardioides deserti]GGO68108.1 N-acetylglucosamine-6-phosphate deacetylase [Nocardioides deserti]
MSAAEQVLRGRVVLPDRVLEDAVVVVVGERIVEVAPASAWSGPPPEEVGTVAPGYVDLHCHGGGGRSVTTGRPDDVAAVVSHHLQRGTTSLVASMVSAPYDVLASASAAVATVAAAQPGLLGAHLEGPWLAPGHCGAHDPAALELPDPVAAAELLVAARGALRMVTLAPELDGARETARALDRAGVLVAAGHTDADAAGFAAALAWPEVSLVTHLFNGMAPFHHREPGPSGAALAALARGQVHAELICDGVHLADETVRLVFAVAPERVVLVSDAMTAAGMPEGSYRLGPLEVEVRGGTAWTTAEQPALAGSTLHLADAVARAVTEAGIPPHQAVRAASATPAKLLGLADRGRIVAGARADLVVLDDDWRMRRVMAGGTWVTPAAA